MKTRLTTLMMSLLMLAALTARADETVTVTATNGDISQNLDLKAVATVFGEAKNLEEFETQLNDPSARISNLDLNGDGIVDYLRVIETGEGNAHLIVLQAVLAKDIYQDVATIYVEKDPSTEQITVQIQGDEYIYGTQYIIEPVYITRPIIYDWFWSPSWYCWHSPWYWGYYPTYWYAYDCWLVHDYWHHIYAFHHHHPYCSYRYRPEPRPHWREMYSPVARRDYAIANPDRGFSQRNGGMSNARRGRYSRRGSYDGGSYEGSYEGGGSYARGRGRYAKRDSMGRYSSMYYEAADDVTEKLKELMEEAPDEKTKVEIRKFITKLEQM